ncbi:MAG: hypothetical protein GY875_23730 [Gammaproteobacteria bacterium]|nr:hypothetical protein [Gammaproteobacteria bacterium]
MNNKSLLVGGCIALLISLGLGGCNTANKNSIFRVAPTNSNGTILIDAKQRAILTQNVTEKVKGPDGKLYDRQITRACAEPNPDAFSVLSSSLSLAGSFEGKSGESLATQLTKSIGESGLNIGLRTQSIQILRDMMYRLCERYFNGAIGPEELKKQAARDHRLVIAVLAIEQLTGAIVPRPAAIISSSTADTGANLLETQKNLEKGREILKKSTEAFDNANAVATTARKAADTKRAEANDPKNAPNSTALEKEAVKLEGEASTEEMKAKDLERQMQEDQANVSALEEKRDAAKSVQSGTSGGAKFSNAPSPSCCTSKTGDCCRPLSDKQTKIIAETVTTLITSAFKDTNEVVLQCLSEIKGNDDAKEWCLNYLASEQTNADANKAHAEARQLEARTVLVAEYFKGLTKVAPLFKEGVLPDGVVSQGGILDLKILGNPPEE